MKECVVRMERIPKNCDDGCWGSLSGECPWCDSVDGYKMVGNRPPNCPIIAVLPEGHGRLIDASTVIGVMQDELDNDIPITVDDYLGLNLPVPTIVPAERSKT